MREPGVFLFDEPLSNLDAKLRVQTRIEIKRLLLRYRTTSLYVTHDQTEAIAIGDRVAVMRAGQIEQVGAMGEVYAVAGQRLCGFLCGFAADEYLAGPGWRRGDPRGSVLPTRVPSHEAPAACGRVAALWNAARTPDPRQ